MPSFFSPLLFPLGRFYRRPAPETGRVSQGGERDARKRISKGRIFLDNNERERLLELGGAIERGVLDIITIVSPRTYQRWKSRVRNGEKPAKKMGRKGTPE